MFTAMSCIIEWFIWTLPTSGAQDEANVDTNFHWGTCTAHPMNYTHSLRPGPPFANMV